MKGKGVRVGGEGRKGGGRMDAAGGGGREGSEGELSSFSHSTRWKIAKTHGH